MNDIESRKALQQKRFQELIPAMNEIVKKRSDIFGKNSAIATEQITHNFYLTKEVASGSHALVGQIPSSHGNIGVVSVPVYGEAGILNKRKITASFQATYENPAENGASARSIPYSLSVGFKFKKYVMGTLGIEVAYKSLDNAALDNIRPEKIIASISKLLEP